ncbi:glycine cleavage system H-protein subunit [Fusarium solani]|nr:glycine cleavage system H-protein subunit [Fusarium solani]
MSGFIARQAWATASRVRSSALQAPQTVFACKAASIAPRRCFSVSLNLLKRRYTESHEWIDLADDGKTCTIGISNYAAEALGDVVYVELPATGDETTEGESFGTVESVKSASDIVAPVSGSVIEVNEPLNDSPADLGKDPEGEGWLIKVEAEDVSALEGLMDEAAYAEHTKDH